MKNRQLEQLNEDQRKAVLDQSKVTLVKANVGSGKTTVLTSKILTLHQQFHVPYSNMVVLTFTNKAANEIIQRITNLEVTISKEELFTFGTFHSVALKLLKEKLDVTELGYTSNFSVIDPDEELEMATRLLEENRLNIKYKKKLTQRFEQFLQEKTLYGNMKKEDDLVSLIHLLNQEKKVQNKMNFNDLIDNATILLKKHPLLFTWIIVDEFQDSNIQQLEFLKALKQESTCLFAVGDPNQVIYSWRGGSLNLFKEFETAYGAKVFTLPINYRSSDTILQAASGFLSEKGKLVGFQEKGEKIRITNPYNSFMEANSLVSKIKELKQQGESYNEIGLLYRTQKQSQILENVFDKEGIPYEVSIKRTLKDIPILIWLQRLLKASINPKDKDSILFVLSHPDFGEGLSQKQARTFIQKGELNLFLNQILNFTTQKPQDFYSYFDLDNHAQITSAFYQENKNHLLRFLEALNTYLSTSELSYLEAIQSFLENTQLFGFTLPHQQEECVKLMTLHACKGLEFNHVFILGANPGLIPLNCRTPEEMDEEKRLFFVGMTRAKKTLEISYYTSPDDSRVAPYKSPYLTWLPSEIIEEDQKTTQEVSLKDLRKAVKASTLNIFEEENESKPIQRVYYHKYGEGDLLEETEDTYLVEFDGYGQKTLLKDFVKLELINK